MKPLLAALALAVLALLAAYLRERRGALRLRSKWAALDEELRALKSRPERQEFRIERFDLLWYPAVTFSPGSQEIVAVSPGVPHCRACVAPLALNSGQWACAQCGARHPESLGDLMVIDSVTQQALKHFEERHKGFRLSLKK